MTHLEKVFSVLDLLPNVVTPMVIEDIKQGSQSCLICVVSGTHLILKTFSISIASEKP